MRRRAMKTTPDKSRTLAGKLATLGVSLPGSDHGGLRFGKVTDRTALPPLQKAIATEKADPYRATSSEVASVDGTDLLET